MQFQKKFEFLTVMPTPIANLEIFECYFVFENQDIKLFQIHVGADDTYADVKQQLLKAAKLSSDESEVDMFWIKDGIKVEDSEKVHKQNVGQVIAY